MKLTDILTVEQFVSRSCDGDRRAVIDGLVGELARKGRIQPGDVLPVSIAVQNREATSSTGIGNGIAIPHANVSCVTEIVAIAARLTPPVDFLALDKQPVSFCVLFLSPKGQAPQHLQFLSMLARFFSNKNNRTRLKAATTPAEMLAAFRDA